MGAVLILRIVHVGLGVFWAGGVLFMNFIVGPAIGGAGPEGLRVMQELNRRRYFDVLLGAAFLTILSGLDLTRRDSDGFRSAWFRSPFGAGISTGMIAAIVAFLIGLLLIKPAMRRLSTLGGEMAQSASPDARAAIGARVESARARLIAVGMVGTLFLIVAVLAMATARYL
ncbi:MAG: hypothetical protein ACRELE_01265 [Gemmatimonadales bacterium]